MQEKKLNKDEISFRIRSAMKRRGIKSKELANLLDVSQVTISKYINGVSIPKNAYLSRISEILNVSIEWILTGSNEAENINEKENQSGDLLCSEYSEEVDTKEYWRKRAHKAEKRLLELEKTLAALRASMQALRRILDLTEENNSVK